MGDVHIGWTQLGPSGVVLDLDARDTGTGPTSLRGDLMDYEEVQLAGDGELFVKSPYQGWRPEDTRIISYVLHYRPTDPVPVVRSGWRVATTVRGARAQVTKQFGKILEENAAGDNVFFRVFKERK